MHKRLFTIAFFLLIFVFAPFSLAQTAASDDTPTKAEVLKFLDLMKARSSMEQMMDGVKNAMKEATRESFKTKVPGATPDQLEKVDAFTDIIFKDFPIDEMMDAMVPIYQKHLTKSDLDAIIAFYSSPVGQKLLKEQPAMMAEGMRTGQDIMMRKLPELDERLKAKMAELVSEEEKKKPSEEKSQPPKK